VLSVRIADKIPPTLIVLLLPRRQQHAVGRAGNYSSKISRGLREFDIAFDAIVVQPCATDANIKNATGTGMKYQDEVHK
jgi:hypothetical protein